MNGSVLSTRAFAGQDARLGFVLMHEVWSWAGSTEPVRVQASIRVNYQP
jgi:flagellar protein FlhE